MPLDTSDRTWLIRQFLNGDLPPDTTERINQWMKTDPAFERDVMAQWLIGQYAEQEGETAQWHRELDDIVAEANQRKTSYANWKRIRHLPELLGIRQKSSVEDARPRSRYAPQRVIGFVAAVLVLLSLFNILYRRYPTQQVGSVPVVAGSDDYGLADSADSVVVVCYDRSPGFWTFGDVYAWSGDTLKLYGRSWRTVPSKAWRIIPTDRRNQYRLRTDRQTYRLTKGTTRLLPLQPDETR